MEKISDFISKKIISINSGNIIGYVLDVLFSDDIKNIEGFLVVDDESEEVLFLSNDNIKSRREECFVIQDEKYLEIYIASIFNNPIGKQVYDENGLNLGKVVDVVIDQKQTKKIVTTKCEFPFQYLLKAGKDCLIYGKKTKKRKKIENFNKKSDFCPKVEIQGQNNSQIHLSYKTTIPLREVANTNSLIGKTITEDILGLNNEIIARKNEKITQKLINKSKLHNKFNQLSYFSK